MHYLIRKKVDCLSYCDMDNIYIHIMYVLQYFKTGRSSYLIVIESIAIFVQHGYDDVCEHLSSFISLLICPVLHLIDTVQRPLHVAANLWKVSVARAIAIGINATATTVFKCL